MRIPRLKAYILDVFVRMFQKIGFFVRKRRGQEITVLDRNSPIELINPFSVDQKAQIECTQPEEDPSLLGKIEGKKFGKAKKSSLELLLEDRDLR